VSVTAGGTAVLLAVLCGNAVSQLRRCDAEFSCRGSGTSAALSPTPLALLCQPPHTCHRPARCAIALSRQHIVITLGPQLGASFLAGHLAGLEASAFFTRVQNLYLTLREQHRLRLRFHDNINMDVREPRLGVMDWVQLALSSDR
jgi:hypothetical protein